MEQDRSLINKINHYDPLQRLDKASSQLGYPHKRFNL